MARLSMRVCSELVSCALFALACGGENPPAEPPSLAIAKGGPQETYSAGGSASALPSAPAAAPGGKASGGVPNAVARPALGTGGASSQGGSGSIGGAASNVSPAAADAGVAPEPPPPSGPAIANPFTMTAHDPLSTFGADVDTASYDLFVRDVGYGHLPDPATVRTEEFVNYFTYAYPAPAADAADPFSISLAAAPTIFADGTTTLRVGIQGKLAPPSEKKPANLVFLVDVSGSMQSAEKLPLVKYVIEHALDVLAPDDSVSVVTYASGTSVALAPTPAGDKTTIDHVVDGLAAGGSTNGAGGIQLAYQQAEAAFIPGGINHVILCTDGDFNVGVSNTADLVSLITAKRRSGVTLTALAFGSDHVNDAMMEAVSDAGNGIYSAIISEEQASRYVESRLLSTLMHIAKDMKIQVEFNPAQVRAYRLLGYEDRAIADNQFRNDLVDAGEVGAGHRVTALYQLVLDGGKIPTPAGAASVADGAEYSGPVEVPASDLVLVKVRYKDVNAAETDPAKEVAVSLPASAVHEDLEGADADLRWAASVAGFAEILRGSPYARREVLGSMSSLIDANTGSDPDRTEFRSLFRTARPWIGP